MTIVSNRRARLKRSLAVLCTAVAMASSLPVTAQADDFWGLWVREVPQRVWWERPFAIIFSFPAMVVTTPFWAGTKAVGAIKSSGSDDD